ncbi:unnamed protein product [Rotaria sordida]|uniref:Uncharacterized protein n=1 Tax=Rotaria sordida TaxID=392033 RepID=A0A819YT79_9BILA|nr:unnamed protein product [Rotaria sordida]
MSGGSQEQHQLVVPNDDSSQTCKSDDQYQQFLIEQLSQSSNHAMRTSLTTNENEVNNYNQQLRIRDVKIVLFDCMKCYVKIPRCKIEQQVYDSNSHTQTNVGREIQEYREEQEIALQKQDNQATSEIVEDKEEENDDDTDDNPEEDGEEQPIQQNVQHNQHRTGLENKRKRPEINEDDIQISRSFSQLSISQRNLKKTKSTTRNNLSNNEISNVVTDANEKLQQQQRKKQKEDNELLSINYVKQFKPSYLKVSDKIFQQMLSNSIEDSNKIVQCLNTNEKLQFVRQMTEATNNLYYFDLERQLWEDYFDLGIKENKWAPRVSKSFVKQHHTCRTYGFHKHIVEQRLQTITQQFQRTINELQQYILQSEQNVKQWQPYIRPAILSNAINECVKSAQQQLR